MKKLFIGLLALTSISVFAETITQLRKQDEGIFEEAREIAARSEEQQRLDLAKLYEKYNLDMSETYAVTKLNYVVTHDKEVYCSIVQSFKRSNVQIVDQIAESYWTREYVNADRGNHEAVLLHTFKDDAVRFVLTSVCRGINAPADSIADALVITKDRVFEKRPFSGRKKYDPLKNSFQGDSTIILKYDLYK
jgi:hypothetical protein